MGISAQVAGRSKAVGCSETGSKWKKTILAKRIYEVFFEYFSEGETHGYQVYFPAIPGIVTWGRTLEEAEANAKEALPYRGHDRSR